ncbi:MAG: oxidoreductase [Chloroflexaceae bacterium]|nr:oxidoreductase [Chloroflexaceae bacterium]
METFKALVLTQDADGKTQSAIQQLSRADLPEGEVLVQVAYSGLNYKDGLAVTGTGKIVRAFPMVPGIDFAGTVVESNAPDYSPGDEVVLTGWSVGERYWGGMAQMARVQAGWLVPLPAGLSLQHAMSIGTAGFTSMLAVLALEEHGLTPETQGEVVVSGAAGGVGSVAVAILGKLGYNVVASTGRETAHDYLRELGARSIIGREELRAPSKRPLESARWAAAIDTVGGDTLAGLLRSMAYGGSVAVCGNAGGIELQSTVFPFILRGVNMLGIESVNCPFPRRKHAWERLVQDLPAQALESMVQVVPLEDIPHLSQEIIQGQVRGRVVIDLNA